MAFFGFTPMQLVLLMCFVALWTSRSLIIRASRTSGGYEWNVTSIVIVTEFVKMAVAYGMFMYFSQGTFAKFRESAHIGVYFAIPGFMYAVINNLYYLVFLSMDAGTFWVLYNLRILISGVITQIVFNRALGRLKWLALLLLVLGCVVHQWTEKLTVDRITPLLLLALQCLLSSLSGVYNEYLFKKDANVDTNVQNTWLYAFTIAFNLLFLIFTEPETLLSAHVFFKGYSSWYCISVIVLTAGGGFATAYILKYLSAIMKEYGSSLVMLASTLGTVYVLGERSLEWNQVASIAIVSLSLYLYNFDKIYPMTAPAPSPVVGKEGSEDVV